LAKEKRREHILSVSKKDLEIQWFHGSGAGGQHRNKHANCCRIIHADSGARAECSENKSREANQKVAFQKLTRGQTFQMWLKVRSREIMSGKTVEKTVEEMMCPENLKIEVKVGNKWVEEGEINE